METIVIFQSKKNVFILVNMRKKDKCNMASIIKFKELISRIDDS